MENDPPRPEINASKLRVGGEIVGAIFAVGTMLIFLIGIPILRYLFPIAIGLGGLIAFILRFVRHEKPGAPWILAATERKTVPPSGRVRDETSETSTRIVAVPVAVQI